VIHLSVGRKKMAAASVGDTVLFGGGYLSGNGSLARVDVLHETAGMWAIASLSSPRFRLQAASVGSLVLFISGQGCDWTCKVRCRLLSREGTGSVTKDIIGLLIYMRSIIAVHVIRLRTYTTARLVYGPSPT